MIARSRPASCPVCAQRTAPEFRPFCSARCKDEDLRRWLVGAYRIPAAAGRAPDDERSSPEEEER